MKKITTLGIDLAKSIFQLHGADLNGKTVLQKRLTRVKLIEFVSNLSPCTIGIEACTGAHYWARLFQSYGHTVKMMAPQFVKPYVQSNKNDRNDAAAIAEAATRPRMKFVPIKTTEQQDILLLHRARQLAIKQRTAQANQIRGLLAEYGIIFPKNMVHFKTLPERLDVEVEKGQLSERTKHVFEKLYGQLQVFSKEIADYDNAIEQVARQDARCHMLMDIEGVGVLTATAIVASVGDASVFKNGREMAAWLGLVPKQHSSGNKIRLGGITKRGDRYLRMLLVHGGRSVVKVCDNKSDRKNRWLKKKKHEKGYNVAAVALANKNARIIWAMLTTGESYRRSEMIETIAA